MDAVANPRTTMLHHADIGDICDDDVLLGPSLIDHDLKLEPDHHDILQENNDEEHDSRLIQFDDDSAGFGRDLHEPPPQRSKEMAYYCRMCSMCLFTGDEQPSQRYEVTCPRCEMRNVKV